MNNKNKVIALAGSASALVVGSASADTLASINAAFTSAQSNVGAVVVGVIALAAVATGVGLIIKFLSH